ncbi:MAG: hypothetical protein Q4A98_00625 [Comamonadaceae bacterium]|nr:hypothetical protein [Comamonadaceae bacterium]
MAAAGENAAGSIAMKNRAQSRSVLDAWEMVFVFSELNNGLFAFLVYRFPG